MLLQLRRHVVKWIHLSYNTTKRMGTSSGCLLWLLRCVVSPQCRRSCLQICCVRPRTRGIYISFPTVPTEPNCFTSRRACVITKGCLRAGRTWNSLACPCRIVLDINASCPREGSIWRARSPGSADSSCADLS